MCRLSGEKNILLIEMEEGDKPVEQPVVIEAQGEALASQSVEGPIVPTGTNYHTNGPAIGHLLSTNGR